MTVLAVAPIRADETSLNSAQSQAQRKGQAHWKPNEDTVETKTKEFIKYALLRRVIGLCER